MSQRIPRFARNDSVNGGGKMEKRVGGKAANSFFPSLYVKRVCHPERSEGSADY